MTYRELLKLYQEGKLDEEQKQEVEQSVEKQEAISEYLYEKEEIPGLEALHEEEAPDAMTKENNAGAQDHQENFLENGCSHRSGCTCNCTLCDFCIATGYISLLLQSQSGYGKK